MDGLQPEEWGGLVPFVPTSAVTKQGIPELLDQILLIAELQELKANPKRAAIATVIESHLDSSLGPLATVIVNTGTLRLGDVCVCGSAVGRVKAILNGNGDRVQEVIPSGAAQISGLDGVPTVGDILQVVGSEKEARVLQESIREAVGEKKQKSFGDLVSRLSEGKLTTLKVVLKADAQGSLEAISYALQNQAKEDTTVPVTVKVIHSAVGAVSENDVMMASASEAVVLAFHANVSGEVARLADREGVKIREYTVLYELLDEVEKLREGLIIPIEEEKVLGHMQVLAIFLTKKGEQIIGGKVTDGIIKRVQYRLVRDGAVVGTGRITSVKHVDKDIKEAKEGSECGLKVDSSTPVLEGDVIEVFAKELKRKEEK
jgi:translation initiation factor IF-2